MQNTKHIGALKHRYYVLCIKEMGLIVLQTIGMVGCALFVLSNFCNWTIGDLVINTGYYRFVLNRDYLSPLCLVVSILLAIPRPANLQNEINLLRLAIKYLVRRKYTFSVENEIIKLAETCITDVDTAYQKKKEGRENELGPHEKRMYLRNKMIVFGIPSISMLTFLLIWVFGYTVPQIVAIDMAIGYAMVLLESTYYQKQLKLAKIAVMSEEHKCIIEPTFVQEQQYKFYQKVFYMEADRYSNYCLVLGVASSMLNILAILLTLLDSTANDDLKKLFAIDSIEVNAEISVIFMVISIVFFLLDILFNFYFGPKIMEAKIKGNVEYSEENYRVLEEAWDNKNNVKDTLLHNVLGDYIAEFLLKPFRPFNTIFSHNALDISRGKYDYNNDSLIEKKGKIPAVCMSTVEDSFPGRVPRFKLTAFVVWVFLFCFLVWGKADAAYLIPISLVSLILYDVIVMFFAVLTWNEKQNWLLFEKEMEREMRKKEREKKNEERKDRKRDKEKRKRKDGRK